MDTFNVTVGVMETITLPANPPNDTHPSSAVSIMIFIMCIIGLLMIFACLTVILCGLFSCGGCDTKPPSPTEPSATSDPEQGLPNFAFELSSAAISTHAPPSYDEAMAVENPTSGAENEQEAEVNAPTGIGTTVDVPGTINSQVATASQCTPPPRYSDLHNHTGLDRGTREANVSDLSHGDRETSGCSSEL